MSARISVREFTLPSYWACALVNGDLSGLSQCEVDELQEWLQRHPGLCCVGCDEDTLDEYAYCAEVDTYCSTLDYQFHKFRVRRKPKEKF